MSIFSSFFSFLFLLSSPFLNSGKFFICKKAFSEIIFSSLFSSFFINNFPWQEPPYNSLVILIEQIVPTKCPFSFILSINNF